MNGKNLITLTGILLGSIGLSVIAGEVACKTLGWTIDTVIKQRNAKALRILEANTKSEIKNFIEEMDKALREGQPILEFMRGK